MKYGDFIQFDPTGDAVRLSDADQEGAARHLVSSFLISSDMAARLTGQLFPALRLDPPAEARMLLVAGPRGVGKTHLLSMVSALAERADCVDLLGQRKSIGRDVIAMVEGLTPVEDVAGRFRVLRAVLDPDKSSMREQVLRQLETFLAAEGVTFRFPPSSRQIRHRPAIEDMMAAFRQQHPGKGLLLLVDDLSDFLKSRRARDLVSDLDFLRILTEACRQPDFRVVAAVQPASYGDPDQGGALDGLRRLRRHCTEIELGARDVAFVAAARMVRKTPEQRARVEAHLARFADSIEVLRDRMTEFVDLFPLHPDFSALFEKDVFAERRGELRLMSDLVERHLDVELPADQPGVIAFDSYWVVVRANPACRRVPEIAAVIDFSRLLEERLDRSDTPAADRVMARRLIHALSIARLTASDVYCWRGITPAQARDSLCLFQPGLAVPEGQTPALALLAHVGTVLEELRKGVNGPRVTVRTHENQYHLHFRKFRRFHTAELVLHWINAIPFLALMVTGAIMLASRYNHVDRELLTRTVGLHKLCALVWVLGMPATVFARWKPHWANIRTLLTWGAEDAVWMIQSMRSVLNKRVHIPPADRFNTGQKINSCLVVLYYFGFAATGALMYWKGTILVPWYVHTALFFSAIGSVGGHLYLALVNPSTRIAIGGIFHGWAPMKYIEHHHALSIPKATREHMRPASLRSIAREVLFSRVEMIILLVTVLLSVVGAYAFGHSQLATVKKQFAQHFADVIQPSRLSTKHDIGPTAESCTKCHSFTGEIPDHKCEECHDDVAKRRADKLGYHGGLKGDCRYCHREHRDKTKTLVPLDPKKFNHDEALFALAGKHAKVKCDDCHDGKRTEETPGIYYLGLPHERCTDCHQDRHDRQFVAACDTCHSPKGWTGTELNFSHKTNSDYALVGRHEAVECRKCHKPAGPAEPLGSAKFKGLGRACLDCHEEPHQKQFADRCTECHSPAGWGGKNLDFEHDKDSKFPLVAKHAQVACDKCHVPPKPGDPLGRAQFKGLKSACADCHKDPHGGQFAKDCTSCHPTPASWKVGLPQFEHNRDTKFALVGKHVPVRCIQCHKPQPETAPLASARFKGLEQSCDTCHTVKHPDSYGATCTACHAPDAWPKKQPKFDHGRDTRFELAGKHLVAKCSACHNTPLMGAVDRAHPVKFECLTCHQKDDPHKGALGTSCAKCHSTVGWKGEDLVFEHNTMTRFPLDRDHENVACAKCHEKGRWKPLDTACSSCHTKFFLEKNK